MPWQPGFAAAAKTLTAGFEQAKPGELHELISPIGTWLAAAGHAEVTAEHHHTGKQCLHIFGGKDRRVEFVPAAAIKMPGHLVFQAERWTNRTPFAFRVEQQLDGKWVEIFNGDKAVVVGRAFKSRVEIPLKTSPKRLRFTCTSPARLGDSHRRRRTHPRRAAEDCGHHRGRRASAGVAGAGNESPAASQVGTTGALKPIALTEAATLVGGSIVEKDLVAVQWLASGTSPNFSDAIPLGEHLPGKNGSHFLMANKRLLRVRIIFGYR